MNRPVSQFLTPVCVLLTLVSPAGAQTVEAVGSRALGMGGAFVAVANDSSATWWNPAGLAAGPFLDMAIARTTSQVEAPPTGGRNSVWSFSLGKIGRASCRGIGEMWW